MPPHSHVKIQLHGEGSISDYAPKLLKQSVAEAFAAAADVPVSTVYVEISAASILITVTIYTSDHQSADAVMTSIAPHIGDPSAATALLATSHVLIDEKPMVTSQFYQIEAGLHTLAPRAAHPSSGPSLLLLLALVVGAIVGGGACVKQLRRLRQERYKNFVDERLGGTGTLEVVASPLHSVQLFGIPERPLAQPAAQVQLAEARPAT